MEPKKTYNTFFVQNKMVACGFPHACLVMLSLTLITGFQQSLEMLSVDFSSRQQAECMPYSTR